MIKKKSLSRSQVLPPYFGAGFSDSARTGISSQTTAVALQTANNRSQSWAEEQVSKYRYYATQRSGSTTFMDIPGHQTINSTVGRKHNNVTHIRQRSVSIPHLVMHERSSNPKTVYLEPFSREPYSGPYWRDAAQEALNQRYALGSGGDGFSARAYWSMRPRFAGEVSIINSIFELKDFTDVTSLAPNMKALFRNRKQLANIARPLMKFGNLASATSKAAASAILTWNLAVKPTVQDFLTISAQISQHAQHRWKEFSDHLGEGSTSHFSERETIFNTVKRGKNNLYYKGEGKRMDILRTATSTTFASTRARTLNQICRDFYGFGAGPEEIWNMLPLSFVLDYIFTVGQSLTYMNRADYYDLRKIEYQESIKVVASSGLHLIQDSRVPGIVLDGVYIQPSVRPKYLLVTGTEGTYYQRRVRAPYQGPALPRFKLPRGSQIWNLVALARCFI